MRRQVSSLFLDVDRVSSVFALLFTFVRDDACDESEARTFESTLYELLRGLKLPSGVQDRLRTLFDREMADPTSFEQLVDAVQRDFTGDRSVLPVVVELVLRVASDDGMVSRCDSARIRSLLTRFDLTDAELDALPEEDQLLVETILYGGRGPGGSAAGRNGLAGESHGARMGSGNRAARVLAGHYQVLGCRPDVSDAELRKVYRTLVMRYHPDRSSIAEGEANQSAEVSRMRGKFEAVQSAYEAIKRARGA